MDYNSNQYKYFDLRERPTLTFNGVDVDNFNEIIMKIKILN